MRVRLRGGPLNGKVARAVYGFWRLRYQRKGRLRKGKLPVLTYQGKARQG